MKFEQIPEKSSEHEAKPLENAKRGFLDSLKAKANKALQLGTLIGALASTETAEAQMKGGEVLNKGFVKAERVDVQHKKDPNIGEQFNTSDGLYTLTFRGRAKDYTGKERGAYDVIHLPSGRSAKIFGDSVEDAKKWAPEFARPLSESERKIIETERAFQQSGLTDPSDAYKGPISIDGEPPVVLDDTTQEIHEGSASLIEDLKAIPEKAVLLGQTLTREVYKVSGEKGKGYYVAKQLSGKIYSFTATSDEFALSENAELELSPSEQDRLEKVKTKEQELKDSGYIKE